MSWNWNKSGRIDSWKFVKVSCNDLNKSLGELEGYVTSGSLTFNYDSTTKVQGKLSIINASENILTDEFLIRIFYCPTLDDEYLEIEVGTFYFTTALVLKDNGTYAGDLELKSTLCRYTEDELIKNWVFKKNKKYKDYFKYAVSIFGKWGRIEGALANRKVKKTYIINIGKTPMDVLQYIAKKTSGQIDVNSHGVALLKRYESPSSKDYDYVISTDAESVITSSFTISNSIKEAPNRVVCYGSPKGSKKVIKGGAVLAKSNKRSKDKIGRYITKTYKVSNLKKPYIKNLKKKAAKQLKSLNSVRTNYEFECYYQPIHLGQIIKLNYGNMSVIGMVCDIEMNLSAGAKMKVKIRTTG